MTFSRDDTKVAKAVAVIMMCMHHLFAFPDRFPPGVSYISVFPHNYEAVLGGFAKLCVMMFICLSGFGTYISLSNKDNVSGSILKKIGGLYKKYWSVFFVFVPIGMLLNVGRIDKTLPSFLKNLIGLNTSYNGEWWFFSPFIVLCIISPLLVRFVAKQRSSPAAEVLIALLIGLVCRVIAPKVFETELLSSFRSAYLGKIIEYTVSFIPSFIVGCVIAKYRLFDKYLTLFNKWYTAIPVSLLVMGMTVFMRYREGEAWDYIYAPIFIIASVSFIRSVPLLFRVACEVGGVSTEIWLTHSFFCYHFIPRVIFAPKYSVLVLLWLIVISYAAGKLLVLGVRIFDETLVRIKSKKTAS